MSPIPLSYTDIAADITAKITAGEYESGAKLPSYSQLADLYSVSFSTAARAVALLRDRGIVIGAPGRGIFVAERAGGQ
ncbi:GntR family transcriptional regulator [Micromonospora globispora]|uniref:winged helix-turn-helix domain-containing protein n=1 Tax=Micromonospora globispora TaxID=1450148 RepID=UPI000D6FB777|nr:winged helix-turn-helix domain-containing protein [Micromonospora globispora]PWU59456.1 GntR family transcriptional regulator [Micromonospora globispora]